MASAFVALNTVFGWFFDVDPVEALEPAAADARRPSDQFVFDVQTHHVAAPRQFPWNRSGAVEKPDPDRLRVQAQSRISRGRTAAEPHAIRMGAAGASMRPAPA